MEWVFRVANPEVSILDCLCEGVHPTAFCVSVNVCVDRPQNRAEKTMLEYGVADEVPKLAPYNGEKCAS